MPTLAARLFLIMISFGRLWMQLCAPRLLPSYGCSFVLRTCCLPMDAASCSVLPRAPRLLPANGYSFVLRACCHAHGCSFVLRVCCCARSTSRTHAGTARPEGTTFTCAPLPRWLMKHLNHKTFVAAYFQNR
jgi:hypothetical protein